MHCPHCASVTTKEQSQKTTLGYRIFRCSTCKRLFNERTGTPFNFLEYPTDIVLLVVLWRLRYKLSLRDLAELFLERGWEFTYEAVREWETRFAPLMTEQLRTKRRGQAGQSWYVDETSIKVRGKWWYLYRAIDTAGNLVDSRLSEKRERDAARFNHSWRNADVIAATLHELAPRNYGHRTAERLVDPAQHSVSKGPRDTQRGERKGPKGGERQFQGNLAEPP